MPRPQAVVWSGKSAPDDTGAHRLLQAVRGSGVPPRRAADRRRRGHAGHPRIEDGGYAAGYDGGLAAQTLETPIVGAQRGHAHDTGENRLLPQMRTVGSAYDEPAYGDREFEDFDADESDARRDQRARRYGNDPVRHAYYPGRRMNLGVVLLPLRIFLGFISIYA